MTHRRAKRLLPRAAAAALAAASASIASTASAQLVYEPFNYPAGSALDGKINPGSGLPWSAMSADVGDDDILMGGSSLSYGGLAIPAGGSVNYAGAGKSERLALGPVISSGTAYFSLLLSVTDLGAMTSAPVFIGGFSNRTGPSDFQPTTVGTRLYLRESPNSTPQAPLFNIGVSKNSSTLNDITFAMLDETHAIDYTLNTPRLIVGSYQINPAGGGTDDVARLYINPTAFGADAAPAVATVTAKSVGTDLLDGSPAAPSVAGFVLRQAVSNVPGVIVDELRVDTTWAQVTPPAGTSWNVDADGAWSGSTNWSGGVSPSASDAFVNFPGVTSSPRTVTLDVPVTVRTLNFTSPITYSLTGSQPINFSTSAAINVMAGNHTVAAPTTLAGDLLTSVGSGSTLTLSSDLAAPAATLTKAGAGTLAIRNAMGDQLSIVGGTVAVLPNGSPTGVSRVRLLNLTPAAKLDLADNALIVAGQSVAAITGLIQSGRNGGDWSGNGIVTSAGQSNNFTTLGVASAAQAKGINPGDTAVWNGQTVTGTDTLVMYTYGGDANLDGKLNVDDYGRVDFNVNLGTSGWYNGDFNYDGKVNVDDYGILDFNVGIQGPPLGSASETRVTSVPEPIVVAPVTLLALARPKRRRHNRRAMGSDSQR